MSKTIYFLGIGGIGMSAIARYFLQIGHRVYGYDHTQTAITDQLTAEGALIHYDEDVKKIPSAVDFVVYTPAISIQHSEYQYFKNNNIPIFKRSQVLGEIVNGHITYAVAGTHGKTTTTAMLAQLLNPYRHLTAFIGGIAKNFDTNFIINNPFDTAVVEADEFDRSFLTLHPTHAIITSMDADHLDIYGDKRHLIESFQLFANQIDKNGYLIIHETVADQISHPGKLVYGFGSQCDFRIEEVKSEGRRTTFTLCGMSKRYQNLTLNIPGKHNVLNAAAACAVATLAGLTEEEISKQLTDFQGVKRRFDYQIEEKETLFIDDYAHHPEELRSIITAVKKLYPERKLTAIFQPHLYTRTRDFAPQFAEVLALADEIILLDIYPARELPIEGITSQFLLDQIPHSHKLLLSKKELISYLEIHKPELLLTLGAGDIDKLVPEIKKTLAK